MSPFRKKEKDISKSQELTILSKDYKHADGSPFSPKNLEIEIWDDLIDEETKIILPEIRIDTDLITGVRNVSKPSESPLSKRELEVRGENGKPYWLMFAEERALEEGRARYQEDKKSLYKEAEIAEQSGHFTMASMYYETLATDFGDKKLFDKARELRDRARSSQLEIVSVDVNKLISQVREGGLAVAYDCPTCGGKLSIDGNTKPESVKQCKYCGSSIETISLTDPIRKILSTLSS